ncbi:MAG TPA: RNA methyltransferase [Opitutaceae bacterium]|nr:RNA methyltransferase [Opitutaceae bacterium]HND60153.1 RNA methyltransferase [Opitutaceae bacterium]
MATTPPAGPRESDAPEPRAESARAGELRLCGLTAVRARFAREPGSIKRLYFDRETGRKIGVICRVLARDRKIYRQVEPAELEKIAGSVHHGGVVAVTTLPTLKQPSSSDVAAWARRGESLLVLDRIGNAHNLGAIARTAAFFGVPRIVIPDDPSAARPNDAAYRVAEGGFESLEVWRVARLPEFLPALAEAGYEVVGAATRGGALGGRAGGGTGARPKPVALVLGNEEEGLSQEAAKACTRLVTIPGSGLVESLNVSVAGAVLMWELLRRSGRA